MTAQRILRDSFRYVYWNNSSLFLLFFFFFEKVSWKCTLRYRQDKELGLCRTGSAAQWESTCLTRQATTQSSLLKQGKAKHQLSTEIKRVVWLIWCRASIHSGTALTPLKVVQKQGAMYAKDKPLNPTTLMRSCNKWK